MAVAAMVGATVGAYALFEDKQVIGVDVNNPSDGFQLNTFNWPGDGSGFPSDQLTLGKMYTFGENVVSTGAYSNVDIYLNVIKTNSNTPISDANVIFSYSYDGNTWTQMHMNTATPGQYWLYHGPVSQGTNLNIYVEVTFLSSAHYDMKAYAYGTDE